MNSTNKLEIDDSLLYDVRDANTKFIVPRVLDKPSFSPTRKSDSSSPLPSLGSHLYSPKCSKKSNSLAQQTKKKYIWVPKGSSSCCVVSENFTSSTSIDVAVGYLEKPFSEPFLESKLSSSWSSYSTTLHPLKYQPIPVNPTSSFASSKSTNQQTKSKCIWVRKGASPHCLATEDRKSLIKIDIVPGLFESPVSPSSPELSSSSEKPPPPPPPPEYPPIIKPTLSYSTTQHNKTKYILVEKDALPLYIVPKYIQKLIKRDTVPILLRKPLSFLTYKDYFATLLYAEDYYFEKWDGFEMENVSMENVNLELHKAVILRGNGKSKSLNRSDKEDVTTMVKFEIDSIPGKRPFLLSKDFAYLRKSGTEDKPFKGIICRVLKSKHLLVEFGKEFYDQHYSDCKYDVKFSLNRVCLKRAHRAIEAASDVMFKDFLFPDCIPTSNHVCLEELQPFHLTLKQEQVCAVHRIVMHQGPSPYLLKGPLTVTRGRKQTKDGVVNEKILTSTGNVVVEAVLRLWKTSSLNRMLICAHSNSACDALMSNLQQVIPVPDIFRSNAAFRELDEVPDDIRPYCPYEEKEELFPCPQLEELEKFRIIISTFMSAFRLHHEGLKAGHFSHIFLVDASSAIEPETLVPLAYLANKKTVIIVSGKPGNYSRWVRSKIARGYGLQTSFFERLWKSNQYKTLNPQVISQLSITDSTHP